MARSKARLFAATALSLSLVLTSVPAPAFAETSDELQQELAVVQEQLNDLYGQSEQVSEQLNETIVNLDTTNAQIEENVALAAQKALELSEAKRTLAGVVAEDYKGGDVSMLAILLGSRSIEEFVSNFYYVRKVSAQREEVIETVKVISAELAETRAALESERAEQERLKAEQEQLQADLESSIAHTQSYIDGLSVQIQEALAAEEAARQEEARRQAEAAAAAAAAEAEAAAAAAQQSAAQAQEESWSDGGSSGGSSSYSESSSYDDSSSYSGGYSGPAAGASTIVSAAISQVGCAYVYGACSPGVAFDCSGLVQYAYACAGYSVPHSSASLAAYCNKPASQAVAGDIVWRPGHVGICIGGGATVEALYPGAGVNYGSVSSFSRAGSVG